MDVFGKKKILFTLSKHQNGVKKDGPGSKTNSKNLEIFGHA